MFFIFCLVLLLHSALGVRSASEHAGHKSETSTLELLLEKVEKLEAQQRKYEEVNQMQQLEIEMLKSERDKDNSHFPLKNVHTFRTRRQSENPAAFFGKMQTSHTNASQNAILKFNNVVTNIGNPYSVNNGLFIAPVSGIYVFSTTVMIETTNDAHVGFFVNEARMTNIKLYGSAHRYDTMSQTAVFRLEAHDIVSVRHYEGDPIFHYDYTSFTGFLLEEDYGLGPGSSIIG